VRWRLGKVTSVIFDFQVGFGYLSSILDEAQGVYRRKKLASENGPSLSQKKGAKTPIVWALQSAGPLALIKSA